MVRSIKMLRETQFGVVPDGFADSGKLFRVTDISETIDRGAMVEEATDVYIAPFTRAGALQPSGNFDATFRPFMFNEAVYLVMGKQSEGAGDYSGYNKYEFDVPDSFTMDIIDEVGDTKNARRYVGCGITSMEFTLEAKEFVTTTVNWIGQKYNDVTSTYASAFPVITNQEQPAIFWEAELYILAPGERYVDIGEKSPNYTFKSCSFTIERALEEDQFVIGSMLRQRLVRSGLTEITGSIDLMETDIDEFKRAIYGATDGTDPDRQDLGSLALVLKGNGFIFEFPQIAYQSTDRSSSNVAEIETSFDWIALSAQGMPALYLANQEAYDPAAPPKVISASVPADGATMEVIFSKPMADPSGKHEEFFYRINDGATQEVFTSVALKDTVAPDNRVFVFTPDVTILTGDAITLSYVRGTVECANSEALRSFSNFAVTNGSEEEIP